MRRLIAIAIQLALLPYIWSCDTKSAISPREGMSAANLEGQDPNSGDGGDTSDGGDSGDPGAPGPKKPKIDTTKGEALYKEYCASCHNPLPETTKTNRTVQQISESIKSITQMKHLDKLSDDQISEIALVLKVPGDPDPPDTKDGVALWVDHCQSCHGTLDSTNKKDKTEADIANAIVSVADMQYLSTLTGEQITKIAAVMPKSDLPPGDDIAAGIAAYNNFCSSCHGEVTRSSKRNRSSAQIKTAIADVGDMNYLSTMEQKTIDLVALVLNDSKLGAIGMTTPLLPNRMQLNSTIHRIFSNGDAAVNTAVNNILGAEIRNKFETFGGLCSRQDGVCPGGTNRNDAVVATMQPTPSPIRRGYLYRVCAKLISNNSIVSATLQNAGLTPTMAANSTNVEKLFYWFYPSFEINDSVRDALTQIGTSIDNANGTNLDRWKGVLTPLCESNYMETL